MSPQRVSVPQTGWDTGPAVWEEDVSPLRVCVPLAMPKYWLGSKVRTPGVREKKRRVFFHFLPMEGERRMGEKIRHAQEIK